jgi:hypothetical protein
MVEVFLVAVAKERDTGTTLHRDFYFAILTK